MRWKCKYCGKTKERIHTGEKSTNGAFIWTDKKRSRRWHGQQCLDCTRRIQREQRVKTSNASCKKYEKTINGFTMRMYRNMKSRVTGVQKNKHHLYKDKLLLDKHQFYNWIRNNKTFIRLFKKYMASGYEQSLAPTVNRIDPAIGYTLDNMEIITHSKNSSLGSLSQWNQKRSKLNTNTT